MASQTILLIEDEKNIVELIKYNLEQEGFHVLTAHKGNTGLEMALKEKPAAVILDLMLPELSGIEICKALRHTPKTKSLPIIMLTAKSTEADKVAGLELGADDYLTKPFSPRELIARIKAVLRRTQTKSKPEIMRSGTLELDLAKHELRLKGKITEITVKEFDLLHALMESPDRVLTRETLLEKVWGYDQAENIETRTIDMHITQLRKKLKNEADRILTVKGVGYRFNAKG